jgi:hypothetical protein
LKHPLHDYVARQVAEKLKSRHVLVWYDLRREFSPFIDEIRVEPISAGELANSDINGMKTMLAEYSGSYFELRKMIEPVVAADEPQPLIIYIAGVEHDLRGSVFMELEKGGHCYEPSLKRLAGNVLKQRYTAGVVDEMLAPERVSYEDLAKALSDSTSAEPPSLLKAIFHNEATNRTIANEAILASWLVSDSRDAEIESKEATRELLKLVRSKIGLDLPAEAPLHKLRAVTVRYLLAGEFRSDLDGPSPSVLDGVPTIKTKDDESNVRNLAVRLRTTYCNEYEGIADRVETELGLKNADIQAQALGSIDTFRFEEQALLQYCGDLIASHRFEDARVIISKRDQSFWLQRAVARKAHWESFHRMAELGIVATEVGAAIRGAEMDPEGWISAYTGPNGWYRVDRAQRRLETLITSLEDEPDERPLGVVRRLYEDACRIMAEGFTKALARSNWTVSNAIHHTRVFTNVVSDRPKPVAYFLVDAMRFEMGVDLSERLPKVAEVGIRAAIAALPSITPIGMAALMPGASASFNVIEQNGKLGARIDDTFLPDVVARKKFASARIPGLVDLGLDELLGLQASKLAKKVDGAQVIIVRSQEIDHAGEAGFSFQAHQVMDTIIDNLARAIRKLANAGVEHSVVTADHGHLFFAADRDESMRIDSPGGDQVELHRRCWIGRGGTTPPGCVRVPAAALGYSSDLEFVFPGSSGVFKSGGDLAFHHGGPSLQELVIPVLTIRLKTKEPAPAKKSPVDVTNLPAKITNRIFSVTLKLTDLLFKREMVVRPFLMSSGKEVGAAGMAIDGELDRSTGCVRLRSDKPATIAFLLADESAASLRIVIQDPSNDMELYRSPVDIPVQLGV